MKNLAKVLAMVLVIAMLAVVLTACGPKDVESAKATMKDAGYNVIGYEDAAGDEGLVGAFGCTKGLAGLLSGDSLVALLYDSADSAKAAFGDHENEENVQRIGKWIVWGSEEAIAAFK